MPDFTNLPNRFDHASAADRIYARWEERGYFHSDPDPSRPPFTIVIPPPNVTGALHLGHALNNTLQDTLVRYKRMRGFNTLWMPGTDHAGIATQAVVERRLKEEEGRTRHDLGREELVRRIWQWKDAYEARILGQLKRMGCSCDWRRTRFTLDDVCARAVRQTFFDLFQKNLIYRGKRLVNWDTFLQTAVSDDEVFHDPVQGHFWHFRYPVINPQPGEPAHVTIATTRPETMLGDTAVAVHPDPAGALKKMEAELAARLEAAPAKEKPAIEEQLENIKWREKETLPQLERLRDMAKAGRKVTLPLLEREIPLIADPWAKPELGSGCVKITPAHDPNDYEVGLRCNLPMINILNPDGTLNENAGPYMGLTIKAARAKVVEDLDAQGLLGEIEDREIDLAHSDRSKTPIEPYLADQWFVRMDDLAQSAMEAVTDGRVKILPPRYAKGYLDWLSEKRDWCIGRQLWWGHRIPVWTKQIDVIPVSRDIHVLNPDSKGYAGETVVGILSDDEREHVSVHSRTDEQTGIQYHHICVGPAHPEIEAKLERNGYAQDDDVLDTWFSSALWPHSTLGWPETDPEKNPDLAYYYPTSTLITSRDIITLWVARMVLMGLNNMAHLPEENDRVPFREVFIHPKILDGYGETMSKSKGNGVDPLDVIDKFGPDALRFAINYICTESQDVRMPVQFECPACETLIDQTKKNRELPRIDCPQCGKPFSTQWARTEEDKALPKGPVVSERFELARNFCNKLWNAARFSLIHLEGYTPGPVADGELTVEDRWILSRLATVTQETTAALEHYRYADAARTLYDFAWDEFCSFFVEMLKARLSDASQRAAAQRVLAHTLDALVRLLSPMIPFIAEEIWTLLGQVAPERGLTSPRAAAESVMIAAWPEANDARIDADIETQFALFQSTLKAVRDLRSKQNIPPRETVEFVIRCDAAVATRLRPLADYFFGMSQSRPLGIGPDVEGFRQQAHLSLPGMEIFVDMKNFIDEDAERARLEKEKGKLAGLIQGKEKKLANEKFVSKAPAEVVKKERESLAQFKEQLTAVEAALAGLE